MKTITEALSSELRIIFPYAGMKEWDLAMNFFWAFKAENFELCQQIKQEFDYRVAMGKVNYKIMQGFRQFNPLTKAYEGPAKVSKWNGLFDDYFKQLGIEVE